MLYAELGEYGEVIGEREYPVLRPLKLDPVEFDPQTSKLEGFDYRIGPDAVVRSPRIVPLTEQEKALRKREQAIRARETALGKYVETVEPIARVLVAVIERLQMAEDPKDPRTRLEITVEDLQALRTIVSRCKDNPVR